MKTIITFFFLTLFLTSCDKHREICCDIVDTAIEVSVLKKDTNIDLLNQNQPGHYVFGDIALEYASANNQKWPINLMPYNKPLLFQQNGKYYMRVFASMHESPGDINKVKIYWTDNDVDVITFHIKNDKTMSITEKILVNDKLMWTQADGERVITILK
ncbi:MULTISPECIES: hypothetical protein [Emticicia]|uniref:hypothetical protein n=1 Tax=Emticicia TaxID=312278 RepID=UPI000C76C434|nr:MULTISPECIES: hypothetical protein [Emticicia]PLK44264.1 hypothetical protein C0V77_10730 [Emticicia sp. TH156]UTA66819.1 hypothetical protein MB380_14535 [Emticicia sp. 21SJ11W-3]